MTIQFSSKVFAQADLSSPKLLKAGLSSLLTQSTDCLVLAYSQAQLNTLTKSGLLKELDGLLGGAVKLAKEAGDLEDKQSAICLLRADKSWPANVKAKRLLLVGLGELGAKEANTLLAYSKVARTALKALSNGPITNAVWFMPSFVTEAHQFGEQVRVTLQLAGDQAYRFGVRQPAMKFKAKDKADPFNHLTIACNNTFAKELKLAVTEGSAMVEGMDLAKDLGNLPPNICTPTYLAKTAQGLAKKVPLKVEVLGQKQLEALGMGSFLSVAKGSDTPPQFIIMRHQGGKPSEAPIVLVGKGITFDSGGYSLKQSAFMDSMKSDMGGAATVTGALALAAARGLKQRVKLYLCCADNMVSGNAFKLGDIIRYRNGKTVEIMNTDAEGRLVLADGLIDAAEQNAPLIIDAATLTGAAKTALGNDYHALFSFDDELAQALLNSAQSEHEPFWRLPLAEFHRSQLPSNFAELNNVAGAAYSAGASTAAAFLSHFCI